MNDNNRTVYYLILCSIILMLSACAEITHHNYHTDFYNQMQVKSIVREYVHLSLLTNKSHHERLCLYAHPGRLSERTITNTIIRLWNICSTATNNSYTIRKIIVYYPPLISTIPIQPSPKKNAFNPNGGVLFSYNGRKFLLNRYSVVHDLYRQKITASRIAAIVKPKSQSIELHNRCKYITVRLKPNHLRLYKKGSGKIGDTSEIKNIISPRISPHKLITLAPGESINISLKDNLPIESINGYYAQIAKVIVQ